MQLASHITYPPHKREPQIEDKVKMLLIAFIIACGGSSFRQIIRLIVLIVEAKLKQCFRGKKTPKAQNTLASFTEGINIKEIRQFLYSYFAKRWRNKCFTPFALFNGKYVISIDGVETHHSRVKHCEDCLKRVHKKGTADEYVEYYHQEVVLCLVGAHGAFYIDSEPVSPEYNENGKDGEVSAAKRLLVRLAENKMLRFFSILVIDALYAKAPFIQLVENCGLIPVVRIKQENYCIMQDIKGLDGLVPFSNKYLDADRYLEYQIREFNHLTSWESYPGELRIVEIKGKHIKKTKNNDYHAYWVIPQKFSSYLSMELIRIVGHWRWKEELNIFRSLKQNIKIQHLAHHHPTSIQLIFLLKCFLYSVWNLYIIRKLNPFTKLCYFLKDLIDFIKINILSINSSFIRELLDTS